MRFFRRRKRRVAADVRLAELDDFLYAASHDEALAAWLRRLPGLTETDRALEVNRVARNMKQQGEPDEVITALMLLSNEQLARAAVEAIE